MSGEENEGQGFIMVDREGSEPSGAGGEAPAIDFSTFALSVGTSALVHLGQVPDPETGEKTSPPNLPLAKQAVETLQMLEVKTRGNLDEDEAKLIGSLLYEIRMRYVNAQKA
ncbi:DUF1844 domain-containing protein [Myxococcota bacterium]|nr:DUF1844 domain-containing protein [Myxococcota bacterium]